AVVVVGGGPGGLQTADCLARTGIPRCAVISRDPAPGGMFRRFPVYQRLISWTKPDAPFERGTHEYEWYDHNSLVGDERQHQALAPEFMDRAFDVPSRPEMEAALVEFATRGGVRVRYGCEWLSTRRSSAWSATRMATASMGAGRRGKGTSSSKATRSSRRRASVRRSATCRPSAWRWSTTAGCRRRHRTGRASRSRGSTSRAT